jgi:predicted membrane channel-forming protein YqfA (hemolysin III family)
MANTKKTVNKRRVVALILLATLIMLPISGVYVHLTHVTETSHKWLHVHVLLGVVFMVVGIYHAVSNWRTLKHYLTGKK